MVNRRSRRTPRQPRPVDWSSIDTSGAPSIDPNEMPPDLVKILPDVVRGLRDLALAEHRRIVEDPTIRAKLAEHIPDDDALDERMQGLSDGLALAAEAWERFARLADDAKARDRR